MRSIYFYILKNQHTAWIKEKIMKRGKILKTSGEKSNRILNQDSLCSILELKYHKNLAKIVYFCFKNTIDLDKK